MTWISVIVLLEIIKKLHKIHLYKLYINYKISKLFDFFSLMNSNQFRDSCSVLTNSLGGQISISKKQKLKCLDKILIVFCLVHTLSPPDPYTIPSSYLTFKDNEKIINKKIKEQKKKIIITIAIANKTESERFLLLLSLK